MKMHDLKL